MSHQQETNTPTVHKLRNGLDGLLTMKDDHGAVGLRAGDMVLTFKPGDFVHRLIHRYAPPFVHVGIYVPWEDLERELTSDAGSSNDRELGHTIVELAQQHGSDLDQGMVIEARHGGPTAISLSKYVVDPDDTGDGPTRTRLGVLRLDDAAASAAAQWSIDTLRRRNAAQVGEASQYAFGNLALAVYLGLRARARARNPGPAPDDGILRAMKAEVLRAKASLLTAPLGGAEPISRLRRRTRRPAWTCTGYVFEAYQHASPGVLVPRFADGVRLTEDGTCVFGAPPGSEPDDVDSTLPDCSVAELALAFSGGELPSYVGDDDFGFRDNLTHQARAIDVESELGKYLVGVSSVTRIASQLVADLARPVTWGRRAIPIHRALATSDLWNTESEVTRFSSVDAEGLPTVATTGVTPPQSAWGSLS